MIVRLIAAAALLVSAGDHFKLWNDVFKHDTVLGPLFLIQVISCVVLAVLLVAWRHWLAPLMAAALAAGTLIGFTVATMPNGLFGDHEKWSGPYVWTATITEVIVIVAGLYAFSRERRSTSVPEASLVHF
jgi:hypothetical protein